MAFRAPASELLGKPSTWRIATVDPMALQALVMAVAGLLLLGFVVALLVMKVSQVAALLPVLIGLLGSWLEAGTSSAVAAPSSFLRSTAASSRELK